MPTVRCRFCDQVGERAVEHIIPRWLGKKLHLGPRDQWFPGSLIVNEHGRQETQHRPRQTAASWTLDGVCRECNGGWMNEIEDEARRPLWDMIQGDKTTLSPANRIEVARWAQLKWLCSDALHGSPTIASERMHAFAQTRLPFDDTLVDLASYRSARDPFGDWVAATRSAEATRHRDGVEADRYELVQGTIRVRHLVLRVVGPANVRIPFGNASPPLPFFLRCWPTGAVGNSVWEATQPLSTALLRAVLFGRPNVR